MKRCRIFSLTPLLLTSACAMDVAPPEPTEASQEALLGGELFAPAPNPGAVKQVVQLLAARKPVDAARVAALATTPHAIWINQGTPSEVKQLVRDTMKDARVAHKLPVLVAYNAPYRDCEQYSAGGALDRAAYQRWIEGFARGIGDGKAIVLLEPDSLGLVPYATTLSGQTEWCQPTITNDAGEVAPAPGATAEDRYALLSAAVDTLGKLAPNAKVYLDGSHSAWLSVGDAAYRLVRAGVQRAAGFFLNSSNYEPTANLNQYGTWVSTCIAAATAGPDWMRDPATGGPHFDWCAGQYNDAGEADYSDAHRATVTAELQGLLGDAQASTHFVLDTSRNGQGPWTPTAAYPDAQNWCNPPGRGAGERPTRNTGVALADAYLWIKVPGESDGSCNRGVAGSTVDPEWGGIVDPSAGSWFPQQALELARLAKPKLF